MQWHATTNECYNEQFLLIKLGRFNDKDATKNAEKYYLLRKVRLWFSLGKDCLCFSCALNCL